VRGGCYEPERNEAAFSYSWVNRRVMDACSENRQAIRRPLGALVHDYCESRFDIFILMGEPEGHGCLLTLRFQRFEKAQVVAV